MFACCFFSLRSALQLIVYLSIYSFCKISLFLHAYTNTYARTHIFDVGTFFFRPFFLLNQYISHFVACGQTIFNIIKKTRFAFLLRPSNGASLLFSCPVRGTPAMGRGLCHGAAWGKRGMAESILGHRCPTEKCLKGHWTLVTERIENERCEITGKKGQIMIVCVFLFI